jgi:hypothetical protein
LFDVKTWLQPNLDGVKAWLQRTVAAGVGAGVGAATLMGCDPQPAEKTAEQAAQELTKSALNNAALKAAARTAEKLETRTQRKPENVQDALFHALNERLTVWQRRNGERIHVTHCRRVDEGCEKRIEAFSSLFTKSARKNELDPFLLAAMAMRESALDPSAVGPAGSYGILQLHPRGSGAGTRFIRNKHFRRACLRKPDACQQEIVRRGAHHLAQWIEHCDGLKAALGGYNRGKCGPTGYTRRVLREHERLTRLADARKASAKTAEAM